MTPKILLLDIETAPAKAYVWGLWKQNVGISQIIEPGRIICWGAKWHGRNELFYADERRNRRSMLAKVHSLLCEADAVVTYNGDKFDLPRLRGAFVEVGLPALPPTASIDLLKTVRTLGAQSNKLAYIAPHLGIGSKVDAGGFGLWARCLDNDPKAWMRMKQYNAQDVRLLGKLYNLLKPHVKNHPRLYSKIDGRPSCKVCGSDHIHFRGEYKSREVMYDRFVCIPCGSWDKQPKLKPQKAKGRNKSNTNKGGL
jgi:hypothetical protein